MCLCGRTCTRKPLPIWRELDARDGHPMTLQGVLQYIVGKNLLFSFILIVVHGGTRCGLFGDTRMRQVRGLCHVTDGMARIRSAQSKLKGGRASSLSHTYVLRAFCLNSLVRVLQALVARVGFLDSPSRSGGSSPFRPFSVSCAGKTSAPIAPKVPCVPQASPWGISTYWASSGPMAPTYMQRVLGAPCCSREWKSMQQAELLHSPCANQVRAPMMKSSMCMARA